MSEAQGRQRAGLIIQLGQVKALLTVGPHKSRHLHLRTLAAFARGLVAVVASKIDYIARPTHTPVNDRLVVAELDHLVGRRANAMPARRAV